MICHLKLVADVMFCKNSGKELKIIGFSSAKGVRELLHFGVFLGSFLLASMASDVHK